MVFYCRIYNLYLQQVFIQQALISAKITSFASISLQAMRKLQAAPFTQSNTVITFERVSHTVTDCSTHGPLLRCETECNTPPYVKATWDYIEQNSPPHVNLCIDILGCHYLGVHWLESVITTLWSMKHPEILYLGAASPQTEAHTACYGVVLTWRKEAHTVSHKQSGLIIIQ